MSDNKLRFLSYEDMCNLPEPEWLVEGLIQKRSTALMFGKSNSFKSFLAIDIGLSVDTGQDWHGNAAGAGSIVSSGGVLFVATEGANGVGRLRIPGWYDHHRIEDVYRRAFLYPKEIRLDVVDDVTCLIETMKSGWPFALVVLDIFGGTMAGSEVEDKTARAWVHGIQRILRETGASVLTVAHTGWQDDSRARMHTHFWGSFDTRLKVEGDKEAMTATLTVERHKDADSNGSWGFRMVQSCETLVPELDVTVKADRKRTLSAKNRAALNALDDALAEAGEKKVGADWPPCNVVRIDTWRQHFYRHSADDTPDAKKKAFQRARDALREHGQVQFYDDHAWRCHG
ncbi:AAA family ATPase [Mesorhizobium sp.]|uniref:AAA family ATPase n=1 Tax=Mesorhizobium sp. TaxID=1871066 RepID=UPI000FE38F5B|nr:AAA family ATPase [Mesorhizobium sp.]RWK36634.1 MAG: AAA family ATPase [Mesorhizobium sp.]TIP18776.1 MAG: AAA family ATPase [Mesorhizobium sp.]TJV83581.1 MAG: AAA family ATPase [Mesorhizobium sp.]TJW16226.1 MAG: AAA family ATPase [Mesorhizobium sp.]